MKHFGKIIYILFALILISGCTSISQKVAEAKALEFVNEKVKFFVKEENSKMDLPQYNVDSVTSYLENKDWIVVMHVSAKSGNETKKNDLIVRLDKKGDVTEFNGKKVPK